MEYLNDDSAEDVRKTSIQEFNQIKSRADGGAVLEILTVLDGLLNDPDIKKILNEDFEFDVVHKARAVLDRYNLQPLSPDVKNIIAKQVNLDMTEILIRKDFEAWYIAENLRICKERGMADTEIGRIKLEISGLKLIKRQKLTGEYESIDTQMSWSAWISCAKSYEISLFTVSELIESGAELIKSLKNTVNFLEIQKKNSDKLIEKLSQSVKIVDEQLIQGKVFTQQMHQNPYWRYEISDSLIAIEQHFKK